MYERLTKCPLCEGEHFQNKIICKDFLVSNESFVIAHCENCSFEFTNPRPKTKFITNFYQSKSYISHSNKITSLTDIVYRTARLFSLKKKIKIVNKFSKKGHLLDYGCGIGTFLKTCKNDSWQITGIEPNYKARNIAEKTTNALVVSELESLKNKTKFEIITLWHVLEHISDINEIINKLRQRLLSHGKLIVAVPNHDAYDAQIYKAHWAAYDLPRHLYHFNQKTMKTMMKKHKLKLIRTIPMKLDAYYISLLSEQYMKKDGKQSANKYYKSIVNGYKSNDYAIKNNNNYSSLIYVFEK